MGPVTGQRLTKFCVPIVEERRQMALNVGEFAWQTAIIRDDDERRGRHQGRSRRVGRLTQRGML